MFMFNQSTKARLVIEVDKTEKTHTIENETEVNVYKSGDKISGKVKVLLEKPGKLFEHHGISMTICGVVNVYEEPTIGAPFIHEFISLAPVGSLANDTDYTFCLDESKLPYDSYRGKYVSINYLLVARIEKKYGATKSTQEIWVSNFTDGPDKEVPYCTEIGLNNCILLDMSLNKLTFHLNDIVLGRITWKLVNIPIMKMDLVIEKHEFIFNSEFEDPNDRNVITLYRYEILDGSPSASDTIPFRLFLKYLELTPTISDPGLKIAVKYYFIVSAYDSNGRKYYKKEEVFFYRDKAEVTHLPCFPKVFAKIES